MDIASFENECFNCAINKYIRKTYSYERLLLITRINYIANSCIIRAICILDDNNYTFPKTVPMKLETHGGDDVGIFAYGPWAHLLTGVVEENVIPYVLAYASCVGDGVKACD